MEIIASVKKLKGQNYRLRMESGMAFDVSEDAIVRHRLLKGEEIDDARLEMVRKESNMTVGYQKALYYLNSQLRSEKEVRDFLIRKEIDEEIIPDIIIRLRELTLLNDLIYAESYVRTMVRTSDKGPSVIRQQLIKRGIIEETLQKALEQYPFDSQVEVAYQVGEKALRKYRTKSHQEKLNKTRQLLMTKGFSSEVINNVLTELPIEKDEVSEQELLQIAGDKLWQRHRKLEGFKRKQKIIGSLMQKGFSYDAIQHYLREKELTDE